jgi:stage III sporulation protein AF
MMPNNALDRYVKLVMGLLIIMAILLPIFHILAKDVDLSSLAFVTKEPMGKTMEPLHQIQENSDKLKTTQSRLIRDQTAARLEQDIKVELSRHFGVEVKDVNITFIQTNRQAWEMKEVQVVLDKNRAEQTDTAMKTVEPIRVEVGKDKNLPPVTKTPEEQALIKRISAYIASAWAISPSQVQVQIRETGE